MIATTERTSTNAYIESLQDVIENETSTLDWLVIAHDDAGVQQQIDNALSDKSAAMLPVRQESWDIGDGQLAAAIQWAVQEAGVTTLVLAGSSAAVVSNKQAVRLGGPQAGEPGNRFLDRVRDAEMGRRRAQDHFAEQLASLGRIPEVAQRVSAGELTIHGLFYRAESGVFSVYEKESGKFHALLEA